MKVAILSGSVYGTAEEVARHAQQLLQAASEQAEPQRLLFVFARADLPESPTDDQRDPMATRLADQDGHQVVGRKRSGRCRRRGIAAPRGKVALAHQKVRSGTVMTSPGDTV